MTSHRAPASTSVAIAFVFVAACSRQGETDLVDASSLPDAALAMADVGSCPRFVEPYVTEPDPIQLELPVPGDQTGARWEGTRFRDGATVVLQLDSAADGDAPTTGTLVIGTPRDYGLPTSPDEAWPPDGDPYTYYGPVLWDGYTYVVDVDQWDGLAGRLHFNAAAPYRRWCDLTPPRRSGSTYVPTRRDTFGDFINPYYPGRCFWVDDDGCTWREADCLTVHVLTSEAPACQCDEDGCFENPNWGVTYLNFALNEDVATHADFVLRRVR